MWYCTPQGLFFLEQLSHAIAISITFGFKTLRSHFSNYNVPKFKRNSELRDRLLNQSLLPSQLVLMDWHDLSTKEQKEIDEKTQVDG